MQIQNIGLVESPPLSAAVACYRLPDWFDASAGHSARPLVSGSDAIRTQVLLPGGEAVLDRFDSGRTACCFARFAAPDHPRIRLELPGQHRVETTTAGGWLLIPASNDHDTYWLPAPPVLRALDDAGHILAERNAEIIGLQADTTGLAMELSVPAGMVLDVLAWRFPPEAGISEELNRPHALENQSYFLWGSHTAYRRPADVYLHLIHGHVYENRYAWPYKRKIGSENDAHALYVTLCGLRRATGKQLYRLLNNQLLLSVLSRQSEDGGWRHGEWTDGMESHYRLHCSAMHLLMDALSERDDPAVRQALEKAAAYVAKQKDQLAIGTWFLHDELEQSVEAMKRGPFHWIPSHALGKSESNMLVLNTQLDTSIALERCRQLTGDLSHQATLSSAHAATCAVLALRPAEGLYRALFRAIGLTFLPAPEASRLPLWQRAVKRLAWKYLIPQLPRIKAKWPRLVMPGGYIDRELTLKTWAHHYQSVNLMDLARYLRRFDAPTVNKVLQEGARFTQHSGIRKRWAELNYGAYALGFWAESLYQLCTLTEAPEYRAWLVDALLDLEDLGMGLPPSLLGANAEAVAPADQWACPSPTDSRLRVANLSRKGGVEWLVVNPLAQPMPLEWEAQIEDAMNWTDAQGRPLNAEALIVPARGWVWGLSKGFAPLHEVERRWGRGNSDRQAACASVS